jgi:hypothetical protein
MGVRGAALLATSFAGMRFRSVLSPVKVRRRQRLSMIWLSADSTRTRFSVPIEL